VPVCCSDSFPPLMRALCITEFDSRIWVTFQYFTLPTPPIRLPPLTLLTLSLFLSSLLSSHLSQLLHPSLSHHILPFLHSVNPHSLFTPLTLYFPSPPLSLYPTHYASPPSLCLFTFSFSLSSLPDKPHSERIWCLYSALQ
jgi:hypothetical protein